MQLSELLRSILPPDENAMARAQKRWDSVAKPIGSLGLLEEAVVRMAGLFGTENVPSDKRAVVVFCADNGVVREGVTQTGPEVTAVVAREIAKGEGTVARMARAAKADVFAVDMGMLTPVEGTLDRRIAAGTGNIAREKAMTRAQAEEVILTGIQLARELKEKKYTILATGEMGIGNTTTSSALFAALTGRTAEEVTGRGAGLSDAGLQRKINAVERALALHKSSFEDPIDALAAVGGFDIAGMVGLFLGGAIYRVPILIDGFISAAAALTAMRICPAAKCAMLASHVSAEPAAQAVLNALGLSPILHAGMRLGEGTGAVCLLPILDLALVVYREMSTFGQIGVEAYEKQDAPSASSHTAAGEALPNGGKKCDTF